VDRRSPYLRKRRTRSIFKQKAGANDIGKILEGDKVRVIVLEDVEGEAMTINFSGPASEFGEFVPEAQEMIDTVEGRSS